MVISLEKRAFTVVDRKGGYEFLEYAVDEDNAIIQFLQRNGYPLSWHKMYKAVICNEFIDPYITV